MNLLSPSLRRRRPPAAAFVVALVAGALVLVLGGAAGSGISRPGIGEPVPGGDRSSSTEPNRPTTTAGGDEPTRPDQTTTTASSTRRIDGAGAASTDDDEGGTGLVAVVGAALVAGLLALIIGVLLGLGLGGRRRPAPALGPAPAGGPAPERSSPAAAAPRPSPSAAVQPTAPPPRLSPDEKRIGAERNGLVVALIGLRDQMPSEALRDEAARALAAAGITEDRPDGQTFDPARHRAVDQIASADPACHNVIASVDRPGYVDGSRVLRQPDVVVYRAGAAP